MQFIQVPHAPTAPVKLAAVSSLYPRIHQYLQNMGVELLLIKPQPTLAGPVCTHADMLLHHLGGKDIVLAQEAAYLAPKLQEYGFCITYATQALQALYPHNIALNAARIGNALFAKHEYTDENIIQYCRQNAVKLVYTNQGYSKCSCCIVGGKALITADNSIYTAAIAAGGDALRITQGHILLPGYSYGFFGGCTGFIDKDTLAVCGDLTKHPDYMQIESFLQKYDTKWVSVHDGTLTDVGSILPLMQA